MVVTVIVTATVGTGNRIEKTTIHSILMSKISTLYSLFHLLPRRCFVFSTRKKFGSLKKLEFKNFQAFSLLIFHSSEPSEKCNKRMSQMVTYLLIKLTQKNVTYIC